MRHPLNAGEGKHDRKVAAFVDAYWKTKFRPPTLREISAACGVSSTCAVRNTLRRLERSGGYMFVGNDAHGIVPVWVVKAIEAPSKKQRNPSLWPPL